MTKTLNPLSAQAHALLRQDILSGAYAPGQPLRLAALQARYGMGFSPLREALTRLSAEGLVTSEAMRGFRVALLSVEDLRDTMATRILVETEALRLSIRLGDDDWEGRIVSSLHALGRQAERAAPGAPESLEALEARHRDFHMALVAASGSRHLQQIIEGLYVASSRYRLLTPGRRAGLPTRDLATEHGAIAAAALERDETQATDLLAAHYHQTAEALEAAHRQASTPSPALAAGE